MRRVVTVALVLAGTALALAVLHAAPSPEDKVGDYVKALKSKDAAVRKQAAAALGEMGDKAKAAVPALREALVDPDEGVQGAVAAALEKIAPVAAATPGDRQTEELRERLRKVQEELARGLDEKKKLEESLKARDAKVEDLTRSMTELRNKLTNAEVERELLKKRGEDLEKRLQEATKLPARPAEEKKDKNPPKEPVEGEVKEIDEKSGLLTVSIGSDAGLEKGHTLEVFRLAPAPKYLGTVRVIEVAADKAVVKFVAKPLTPPEKGDKVASKIQGN
jgi:chromosome segregation ATPase